MPGKKRGEKGVVTTKASWRWSRSSLGEFREGWPGFGRNSPSRDRNWKKLIREFFVCFHEFFFFFFLSREVRTRNAAIFFEIESEEFLKFSLKQITTHYSLDREANRANFRTRMWSPSETDKFSNTHVIITRIEHIFRYVTDHEQDWSNDQTRMWSRRWIYKFPKVRF
jgi:hypothetical protein